MNPLSELARELRVEEAELNFLSDLDNTQLQTILDGLRASANMQEQQIEAAIETALSHLPRALQRPVRKILFRT